MKLGGVKKASNKTLAIVLASIGILIVGVIIAIVVVLTTRSGGEVASETSDISEDDTIVTEKATEEYLKLSDEIMTVIQKSGVNDEEYVLSTFKNYASKVENKVVSAMLKMDYLNMEMMYDLNKEKGEEILDDAMRIDQSLRTVDSAVVVLNMADYYGNTEVYEKYEKILNSRQAKMEIDMEMRTEG